jgi:hypothetical protein
MRALARHDRHGRVWARWILANVVLARVWAVHRHDQQVYGSVLDMIITREKGQRGLVACVWCMGTAWPSSALSML